MLRYLLLFAVLCSPALAVEVQPTAKPYEPILISHEAGANIQILPWRGEVPKYLEDRYVKKVGDDHTVFGAPPGAYLVFGGGNMAIVIIEGEVNNPKPDPPGGTDPKPDPEPDPDDPIPTLVFTASRDGARALADIPTASAMAEALASAINQTRGSPLETQRVAVRTAIETVLLNRTGASSKKDWISLWRRPVNDAIEASDPEKNYAELVDQMVRGLRESTQNTNVSNTKNTPWKSKITFYSLPNCEDCIRWEENEIGRLVLLGWEVEKREAPPGSGRVPWFEVCTYGQCYTHSGYLSGADLTNIVNSLRP